MRETYNGNRSGAIGTSRSAKLVSDTRSGSLGQQEPSTTPRDPERTGQRYVIVSERGELKLKRA
jgi:hypothetical protein